MSSTNTAASPLDRKVVYWGAPFAGKRTSVELLLRELGSEDQRALGPALAGTPFVFALAPRELCEPSSPAARVFVHTISGQVIDDAGKRAMLQGADGVVFVADSQEVRMPANRSSFEELRKLLDAYGRSFDELPFVVQLNKRDAPTALPLEVALQMLGFDEGVEIYETVATRGVGVVEAWTACVEGVSRAAGR